MIGRTFRGDEGGGEGGYAFASACEAEVFCGGGFDADAGGGDGEVGGDGVAHLLDEGEELGGLCDDGEVDVFHLEALLADQLEHSAEQYPGVGALISGVSVGEVIAYVAEGSSAKEGVAQGVESHVGIAMAQEAFRVGNLDPAEP